MKGRKSGDDGAREAQSGREILLNSNSFCAFLFLSYPSLLKFCYYGDDLVPPLGREFLRI